MAKMKMSLADLIAKYSNSRPVKYFSLKEVIQYFYCLTSAMSYLHSKHIAHKDIKPDNIFLNGNNQLLAIGDFGLSSFAFDDDSSSFTNIAGTRGYLAPELHSQIQNNETSKIKKKHFKIADVWSLGVTILEICLLTKQSQVERGLEGVEGRYGAELRDIIGSLLAIDPRNRATCEEVRLRLKSAFSELLEETLEILDERVYHPQSQSSIQFIPDNGADSNDALLRFIMDNSDLFKFSASKDFSIQPRNPSSITNEDFKRLFSDFEEANKEGAFKTRRSLKFDFAYSSSLTDETLNYLNIDSASLKGLRNFAVNLSNCGYITDGGAQALMLKIEKSKSLKSLSLDFSYCPNLSMQCFKNIADSVQRNFSDMDELTLNFNGTGVLQGEPSIEMLQTFGSDIRSKLQNLSKFTLDLIRDVKMTNKARKVLQAYFDQDKWDLC